MDPILKCLKCKNPMEVGFLIDSYFSAPCKWYPGIPKKKTIIGMDAGVEIDLGRTHPATTYRCISCGYMEFYAK